MKLSVASYSFHGLFHAGHIDLFGYLESVRYRYGLRTADIWNKMLVSLEPAYVQAVRAALHERELELVNLCVDGCHLWEADSDTRDAHRTLALETLAAAETLGAKTVRIDAGGREERWTDEQFDYIVTRFREYAQRAYDNGYLVGPENHWGTELAPANMLALCEAVDHPGFGVLLHFKEPDDRLYAKWVMHTHIAFELVMDGLEEALGMLAATDYAGAWSAEHHSGEREYDEVAIQLATVRNTLKRLGVE